MKSRLRMMLLVALIAGNEAVAGLALPNVKHIFTIVLENADQKDALNQTFLSQLAKEGALLAKYKAVTHPSQPNYIALIAGDQMGVLSDSRSDIDGTNLVDLLEAKGKSWKVYAEDFPGSCFQGTTFGKYARKHNPFISFKNIQSNPARCAQIVNSDRLNLDVSAGTLPDYAFYIPDLDHDGHDTNVEVADTWLENAFSHLLKDPRFMDGTLFVVTFDEAEGLSFSNDVYTVFYGSMVQPGRASAQSYDHYSYLRTVEQLLGLENLGRNDAKANWIDDVWKN